MVAHIYADGRLGNVQPIGFAPDKLHAILQLCLRNVGGFLLAGAEIDKLAQRTAKPRDTTSVTHARYSAMSQAATKRWESISGPHLLLLLTA